MAEINRLRELRILDEAALKLQAGEYERRLALLNHENERILAASNKAILREVYERDQKELLAWKLAQEVRLAEAKGAASVEARNKAMIIAFAVSAASLVMQVGIVHLPKFVAPINTPPPVSAPVTVVNPPTNPVNAKLPNTKPPE